MIMTQPKTKTKYCSGCRQILPAKKFGIDRRSKDGRYYLCLDCANKAQRSRRACRKKVSKSEQEQRDDWLKREYNITLKQHKQIYSDQGGQCFDCGADVPYDDVFINYDYQTKKVRGLVGKRCYFLAKANRAEVYKGLQRQFPALKNLM